MRLPKVVEDLVTSFERLPGIGRRSAQRLAFYLLRVPQRDLDIFAKSLSELKQRTELCKICHNLTDKIECSVCADPTRDHTQVLVVETFQDLLAIEKGGSYRGVYHVLHGAISPLNNIGPDELYISTLLARLEASEITELVLATSTSLEGEATALYISDRIAERKAENSKLSHLKVSRLGRGLPTGVELEYADEETLHQAFESRRVV